MWKCIWAQKIPFLDITIWKISLLLYLQTTLPMQRGFAREEKLPVGAPVMGLQFDSFESKPKAEQEGRGEGCLWRPPLPCKEGGGGRCREEGHTAGSARSQLGSHTWTLVRRRSAGRIQCRPRVEEKQFEGPSGGGRSYKVFGNWNLGLFLSWKGDDSDAAKMPLKVRQGWGKASGLWSRVGPAGC